MARKKRAYGSQIAVSTDSGSNYTTLTDIRVITPQEFAQKPSDITTHDTVADADERMPGPGMCSTVKFACTYHRDKLTQLLALRRTTLTWDTAAPLKWKISVPLSFGESTKDTLVFQGWLNKVTVKDLKPNDENAVEIECEIEESDTARVFTAGA